METSSRATHVPTLKISNNDMKYFICFIYKYEQLLKEYGAIKIQLNPDCKLPSKKCQKSMSECSIFRTIKKANHTNSIYIIQKTDKIRLSFKNASKVKNETEFWSLLSGLNDKKQLLNASTTPSRSFFLKKKKSTACFDIHCIPKLSLLRIGGDQITSQYLPSLKRADQSGAIFPLASTRQHLFSIDYHHEGGCHYWYVIPSYEREALQNVLHQENLSVCLDHEEIFIDPSILDKNNIRYHRISQYPNELVVLSAGTLAQSFTDDASWSESIPFALPSWIEDGHANASITSCQCNISLANTFDPTLFRQDLIDTYIRAYLNTNIEKKLDTSPDDDSADIVILSSSNDDSGVSADAIDCVAEQQSSIPLTLSVSPFDSTWFLENDLNTTNYTNEPDNFLRELDEAMSSFDLPNLTTKDSVPMDMNENVVSYLTKRKEISPDETLFDEIRFTFDSSVLEHTPIDMSNEMINISSSDLYKSQSSNVKKKKRNGLNKARNNGRTLFISGLKRTVSTMDLRKHFTGCTKVILKKARSGLNLNYAFIIYHSSQDAANNLLQPVNNRLFGHECRVEFAYSSETRISRSETFDKKKIVVRQIPQNVSEADLHNLFGSCDIEKYCPAAAVHSISSNNTTKRLKKILPGYAFIRFNNKNDAVHVINHADQYQIVGQQLSISFFRNQKLLPIV